MTGNSNQGGGVSIRPTEAVQMGLIDNFDGNITDSKFVKWNYNGKNADVLALAIEIEPDEGEKFVQYYSAGEAALKNFVILEGNTRVKAVNPNTNGLPAGSNAVKFLTSFVNTAAALGFTEDQMSDDVSILVGFRGHFVRVAQEKNKALAGQKENASILLIEKMIALPGTEGAAKPKKAAAGAPATGKGAKKTNGAAAATTVAAQSAADANESKATATVLGIVASRGGTVSKQDMAGALFTSLNGDPDRNTILGIATQDAWLSANKPWKFDGSTLSL